MLAHDFRWFRFTLIPPNGELTLTVTDDTGLNGIVWRCFYCTETDNKKVLLREHKRHTTRRVASARYTDLSPDRGKGTPIQT